MKQELVNVENVVVVDENKKVRKFKTPEEKAAEEAAKAERKREREFKKGLRLIRASEKDEIKLFAADQDKWYRNVIEKNGNLEKEDELALGMIIRMAKDQNASPEMKKNGKAAKDILVNHNLNLVYSRAMNYKGCFKSNNNMDGFIEVEDLVQEGNIGLIDAAEKFDYTRDCRFSTFATWYVDKYIKQAVTDAYNYNKAVVHYAINDDDDAEAYENMFGADEHDYYADVIDDMTAKYVSDTLHGGIDGLKDIEKQIIAGRYGLDGSKALTVEELAKKLKISKNGVRYCEERAINKLKNSCQDLAG